MPDLNFQVEGVEPRQFDAEPAFLFRLAITEKVRDSARPTAVHSVLLRCQIRIEPGRRRYTAAEQERLLDLFGTPERWGQTLRPFLWTHVSSVVGAFTSAGTVDLRVPCSFDFSAAATRYFDALQGGDVPLCFLFSGTIFYETPDGGLTVQQIPWEKEAYFQLSSEMWRRLADMYYPNVAWLCLRKDVFDALSHYKSREGLPTREQALERLLARAEGVTAS